ncbi:UDP-N-acetylmuramoyl-L-alanyl-D-glutamate--2, 6-diaminopimelate ligase [Melia azedarach]|uniref:UDP-N-acetylmuramoyl-L-alanyl-D-glutamate--2, 6-diaminopimelate ligase n=1 Tax=Melia azedarach TaxID=155640 RepID=A0ACC1XUQ2_MELAZ|nr:UDP-N-acetylmuramoyl-L-alanyl-D-glutamate--2, 6-diaminopimelate ligase [Melia azedarach]
MSEREDYDSDAPEEFTAEQGLQQDEQIRKVQKENKDRVRREGKERRRLWAQRKTPRPAKGDEDIQNVAEAEPEPENESLGTAGMLPSDIVEMLAAREKQVFLSDSEDEKAEVKPSSKRKKKKSSGLDPVILNDIPPPECLKSSLEFLKKRKMQVPRSSAVLNNSNQALRLLSTSGLLK